MARAAGSPDEQSLQGERRTAMLILPLAAALAPPEASTVGPSSSARLVLNNGSGANGETGRVGLLWSALDAASLRRLGRAQRMWNGSSRPSSPLKLVFFDRNASEREIGEALASAALNRFDAERTDDFPAFFPADADGGLPRWKRGLDLGLACLTLLLVGPLMALIALGIKLVDPGPVLFVQERVGYRGRRFRAFKFRSMRRNAPTDSHRDHLRQLIRSGHAMRKLDLKNDPRLIPLGKVMRALALDELPQLFNVLRGEMSLVGPRPPIPYEYEEYEPWQKLRLLAVPGMSGLWQVSGKNELSFTDMVSLDIRYGLTKHLGLDLWIIFKTPQVLIRQLMEAIGKQGRRK